MKNLFVITDPGLDPDDLVNAWLMVKLRQQGLVNIIGAIANFSPSLERAKLLKAAFNVLGADNIPVGVGTDCNSNHTPRSYEFDFAPIEALKGGDLFTASYLWGLLEDQPDKSVTLLLISGLTDIAQAIAHIPGILKAKLAEVYIMGGAQWIDGKMIADPTASNNRFDRELNPQTVYDFFIDNQIPLKVLSRHAAYAASISPDFYEDLITVNALGEHLKAIQSLALQSLWRFANKNPPDHRQTRQWFAKTFCDLPDLPIYANENPWRFVKNLALYDPLTTMWAVFPGFFNSSFQHIDGTSHQIVGTSPEESGVISGQHLTDSIKAILLS